MGNETRYNYVSPASPFFDAPAPEAPDPFRVWLSFCLQHARYNSDACDPKAAQILANVLERYDACKAAEAR